MRVAAFALFTLAAMSALAQNSLVNGSLVGAVSDSTKTPVQAASVVVRDVATNRAREAKTNAEGSFQFFDLPAAVYEVSVAHAGFTPYRNSEVSVSVGASTHLDVVLQLASVATQISVIAQPSAIDPDATSVASSVDTERIEELPVESRNYLNFVLLAPGVSTSPPPAQQAVSAQPDSGFTFGGLRGSSNHISIDGVDNNDEFTGASRTELSLETIQEFQVVNSGLSAESGGASGGSINVITRVGADDLHGDAFVFLQNGALNARDPFQTDRAKPALHRYRAGAALGGPIVKDRTFYYAAFEQEHSRSLEDSFIAPAVAAAVNGALVSGAYPRLTTRGIDTNLFPVARAETEASAKINHELTPRHSLMLRDAFTNNREAGDAFNASGLSDASARGSSFIRDNAVVGALTSTFNPESIGDLRFQFAERHAVTRTADAAGPGIDIAGLANFGRPYYGNGSRTETHDELSYTYTRNIGRRLWTAGATVNRVQEDARMADGFGGTFIFANLADFLAGRPNQFRQAFGGVRTDYAVQNYGLFVQDHWKPFHRLTIDYGLRYDFEHLPAVFRQDRDNFSPRVGLAFQAAPSWILRAGYGIFFDRYVLGSLNPALQLNGAAGFEQVLSGAAAEAALQASLGGPLPMPLPGFLPSIYRADPNLATPYSQQTSAAVQHALSRDLTATVSYLFVRGVKLSRTRNLNPPLAARQDPLVNDVFQLEDSASSTYQGVTFLLNRRMSNELEFSAAYTLSRTFDDASAYNEQPDNPFLLSQEWAPSRQDQRQRLVFNALWELPVCDEEDAGQAPSCAWFLRPLKHLEVAPIVTLQDGLPVDPLTGVDNGSDAFPLSARPGGLGRNSFRSPAVMNTDFRLLKYWPFRKTAHLDLVAEAFNLFNHANAALVNPVFGMALLPQSGFLQPVTGAGPRRVQFSLDFEF